ncbi:MAG: beta-galactosidase [Phycisphaeraceae bacterium JB051]
MSLDRVLCVICCLLVSTTGLAQEKQIQTIQADGKNWLAFPQTNVKVIAGSALDFSHLVDDQPAGSLGFTVINARGELVFTQQPDTPIRIMGCAVPMMDFKYETDEQIAEFAQQIRMAGYNAVRPHWLDIYLMYNAPADAVFNPDRLARFDRLSYELKQRGIYLVMDAVTSGTMYKAITSTMGGPLRKEMRKLRTYYEADYQQLWKQGVRQLLEHVNPHTGLALKDEPQMLYIAARNEPGIGFQMPLGDSMQYFEKGIKPLFVDWLKQRYTSFEQLKNAWGDSVESAVGFEQLPTPGLRRDSQATRDLHRFITDYEKQTFAWMRDELLSIGLKCPVIDYNNGMAVQCAMTRSTLNMVDMHAYHDHPHGWGVKAKMHNGSLIESGAAMAYRLAGASHLGAPFLVSEWGNPFFNFNRHECGMVMGAYASLQSWQMIIQHALPVELEINAVARFFRVARDPSLKAAERMATLLYASHAVAPAKGTIGVKLDPAIADTLGWANTMPSHITRLALISKLGLQFTQADAPRADLPVDLTMHPQQGAQVIVAPNAEEAAEVDSDLQVTEQAISYLRQKQILTPGNQSNVQADVYQSDTNQITIKPSQGMMSVDTPTSQGVSLSHAGDQVSLADTVWQLTSGKATMLLCALDRKPVNQSQRMLLIVASDSRASGSQFTDHGHQKQILSMGKLPMLISQVQATLKLKTDQTKLRLWALGTDGKRVRELPVVMGQDGQAVIQIDLAELGEEATQYFEWAKQ